MYIAEITCMVALLLNNKAIFSITNSIDSDDFRSAWLAVKTIRKHGPMKHDASIPLAHLAKCLCVAPGCYKHLGNLHWLCDTVIFLSRCYLPRFGALPHIQWSDVPSVLTRWAQSLQAHGALLLTEAEEEATDQRQMQDFISTQLWWNQSIWGEMTDKTRVSGFMSLWMCLSLWVFLKLKHVCKLLIKQSTKRSFIKKHGYI